MPLLQEKIIDVSRALAEGIAVWPGDAPFALNPTARIAEESTVNLNAVAMSLHTGTHADAPLHVEAEGAPLDALPLSAFIGPAQLLDARGAEAIRPSHLPDGPLAPRVLFKTDSSDVPDTTWAPDFAPILPATVETLAARGVVLVGTDAPSVDPAESTDLPAHHALVRHGIVNLENLVFRGVAPGRYWLAALPLRLVGVDASPVRAVLLNSAP